MIKTSITPHQPIMKDEVVASLIVNKSGIYLDCTLGFGGHSDAILKNIDKKGTLIGLDCDQEAYRYSRDRFKDYKDQVKIFNSNYTDYRKILESLNVDQIDGALLDLGISSYQIDNPGRGFSYRFEAPLDMRFDTDKSLTARTVLNEYSEHKIGDMIKFLGEEKNYKKIAKTIVQYSKKGLMNTTYELKTAILESTGDRRNINKVLSRVFQSIRIEVNKEFESIKMMLEDIPKVIKIGGKLVLITFHSLEDRIVKKMLFGMHDQYFESEYGKKKISLDSKKVVKPNRDEILKNKRSRSAKLRSATIIA